MIVMTHLPFIWAKGLLPLPLLRTLGCAVHCVQLTDCAKLLAVEGPLPTLWKPETIEHTKPQALRFHKTAHIKRASYLKKRLWCKQKPDNKSFQQ